LLLLYLLGAYLILPGFWRFATAGHPAIEDTPRFTRTVDGISGDPVNIALVGTEEELVKALLAANWHPADRITFVSALRMVESTVLSRQYEQAPVSNLYVWGRKHDLAFQQPVGHDPRRRHHVRFWRSRTVDAQGRPMWIGASTFDRSVGFSHTTLKITHHIAAAVDDERDKLVTDLQEAACVGRLEWVEGFHTRRQGHNGGGDPYHTDGKLVIAILVAPKAL
jgi:hypothetical protein